MSDSPNTPPRQETQAAHEQAPQAAPELSPQQEASRERDFDAFAVRNDKTGKGHFHKIGAAFKHRDGEGYDIDMVAAPTNGRLTLRTPRERLEAKRTSLEQANQGHSQSRDSGHERD